MVTPSVGGLVRLDPKSLIVVDGRFPEGDTRLSPERHGANDL